MTNDERSTKHEWRKTLATIVVISTFGIASSFLILFSVMFRVETAA
jgi:uncharacterized membrane protein